MGARTPPFFIYTERDGRLGRGTPPSRFEALACVRLGFEQIGAIVENLSCLTCRVQGLEVAVLALSFVSACLDRHCFLSVCLFQTFDLRRSAVTVLQPAHNGGPLIQPRCVE